MGQEAQSRHTVIDSGGWNQKGEKLISSQLMAGKRRHRRTFFGAELVRQRPGFRHVMHHLPWHPRSFQGLWSHYYNVKKVERNTPFWTLEGQMRCKPFFFPFFSFFSFFFFSFFLPGSLLSLYAWCAMCSEGIRVRPGKKPEECQGVHRAFRWTVCLPTSFYDLAHWKAAPVCSDLSSSLLSSFSNKRFQSPSESSL